MSDSDRTIKTGTRKVCRRRFLGATGAAGLTVGIAGCIGGDGDSAQEVDPEADIDEDVTVEITMDGDFAEVQGSIREALQNAGLDSNITVDILPGDFDTGSRRADFTSALDAGRSSPDVFMMDSGWAIPFFVREQVLNLDETLTSETLDYVTNSYVPSAVQTATHPETGNLYGVPLFPDYPVMHYRKDLVEEAGYSPESNNWATEPMSWQEFAEMAADVWDFHGGQDEISYGFTTQASNYVGTACCTFNEMMTSFGGAYFGNHQNLFGPVGERPITVNEDEVITTIQVMRSFMQGPDAEDAHSDYPQISTTDLVEFTEIPSLEPFQNDNAVFNRNWPFAMTGNVDEYGDDYDVMPLPFGVSEEEGAYEGTGGTNAALGGWHLTINPNSDNLSAAAQVVEAFANENVMNTLFREGGWLPPDPAVTEAADEDVAGEIARFLDTLSVAGENTVPRPVTVVWPDQEPLVFSEIHSAYTGEKTAAEAMADLEGELQDTEEM